MVVYKLWVVILLCFVCAQSQHTKVAVVTGANKGVGYAIVKGLCEKFDGHVYLTSRDENRGKEAVNKLKLLGLNPLYHQLDIVDLSSIQRFKDYINETEGGIDILVNNAAVFYYNDETTPFDEQVENTLKVNYFGLVQVSDGLFPLLRRNARVVNLSSAIGTLSQISSRTLRAKLASRTLTISQLSALMNQYITAAKQRKHGKEGWPSDYIDSPYVTSKIGVSALTFIQQRNLDSEKPERNIAVNCVHPGSVDTDLTNHQGYLTPEQGAIAPLYLAIGNHHYRGQFLLNNLRVLDWYQ